MISLTLRRKLKDIETIVRAHDFLRRVYLEHFISDERLVKRDFKRRLGREVELKNPTTFNDKLQWLKLNWYDPLAAKCADKYAVREVVREKIGEEYLNELIEVYESVDEIDISKLPEKFVLKGTHGSGFNIICRDKSIMNWEEEFKRMRRWLRTNYFWHSREWVYKDHKPRIICEKYLEQPDNSGLRDYKVFCFNGAPKLIQVDMDRFGNHRRNIYDLDWNLVDCAIQYPRDVNANLPKPEKLAEMIELSKVLSADFPHVRVDFYCVGDSLIFGELTFFHENGMASFSSNEFEVTMGSWLRLPDLVKRGGKD